MTSTIPAINSSSLPQGHPQNEGDSSNREKRKGPRLAHRKSRTGCQRCRARRVKCDEARPPVEERAVPPSTWIQYRPLEPSPSDSSNDEHMELRLLHYFTLFTSATMPGAHLKRIKDSNPNEASLPDIHCIYLERALREHRLCIGGITTEAADAVFFTNRPAASYEQVKEWMHLVRGSVAVFDAALEIMRRNTHSANIWCIIDTSPIPLRMNSDAGSFSFLLPTVPDDEDDETALEAYQGAVAHINATWLAMEAKEHPQISCRRLLVFPLFVATEFIDLLEKRRPRAMVVLAYFLALSAPLRDIWWIGDTAHKYIMALQ
ncbi:hypothetical protein BDV26DRAFT_283816 [Aspergillus bertholletiae]|uniref:Zn(2)-C6 fungal-type domain-containing protein n=1 Tax=Aspergillus bertholletiae TaxID=1226010 RepID=A0A5N7B1G9_9EURO|nr:hypothetical protein BDV26DRAFT_283816 [Aspergillus bertholletiae]